MAYATPCSALNNTCIYEILPHRPTVFVWDDAKLGDALNLLNERRLTALPVYRRQRAEGVGLCRGWLDMRTVMLYFAYGKFKNIATATGGSSALFDPNVRWKGQPVAALLGLNPENNCTWEYRASDAVAKLCEPFTKGVHRVLILPDGGDNNNKDTASEVCTQTDVVRWIFHSHSAFGRLTERTVEELGLLSASIVSVTTKETALDAFRKAADKEVTAVGVIDASTGRLVGNISASDLKALDSEHLRFATLGVVDFLEKYSPKSMKPLACTRSDSMRAVIMKMLQNRVHRIWIVDAQHMPIGAVSMTDVIRAAASSEAIGQNLKG